MTSSNAISVIDLFAGPGGLGEGFSAYKARGRGNPFRISMSVEMERHAHRTLRLRSFYRHYSTNNKRIPESYYRVLRGEIDDTALGSGSCNEAWRAAEYEAIHATLGTNDGDAIVSDRIHSEKLHKSSVPVVLLGGPPCQAYSLVGRARNRGIAGYRAEDDGRHILYRQYLKAITTTWPVAFIMENVKGILSSRLNGEKIFPQILEDLREPLRSMGYQSGSKKSNRYRLQPVVMEDPGSSRMLLDADDPRKYLVRCEEHGIPQKRHRVFVVGIREDIDCSIEPLRPQNERTSLWSVIGDLPPQLSKVSTRFSKGNKKCSDDVHVAAKSFMTDLALKQIRRDCGEDIERACKKYLHTKSNSIHSNTEDFIEADLQITNSGSELSKWLIDKDLNGVCNHVAKSHMPSDLARYLFASVYAKLRDRSPNLQDYPTRLLPKHANARTSSGEAPIFNDRFRVQLSGEPATTVTSHLAKDGHYFIHPDPQQIRSLTVREAARIQTFPDNYYFCGPRTSQYQQVGNAVPPYFALKIAKVLYKALAEAGI